MCARSNSVLWVKHFSTTESGLISASIAAVISLNRLPEAALSCCLKAAGEVVAVCQPFDLFTYSSLADCLIEVFT